MSSRIVKCDGIVLRNLRYGDTSRVATLFTRELGKISVIGKGVREPKSPFGASLELFCRSEFVVYHRVGRSLQMLKSGDVFVEYAELIRQHRRYRFGCAVLEFLDRMLLEDEPSESLYSVTCRALEHLETVSENRLLESFRAYQLRAGACLGYAPMLDQCLSCGDSLEASVLGAVDPSREVWCFLVAEGGALCPRCRAGDEEGLRLTARALWRIRTMSQGNSLARSADADRGAGTVRETGPPSPPNSAWIESLDFLVEEFLLYHVDRYRGLRSLETARALAAS